MNTGCMSETDKGKYPVQHISQKKARDNATQSPLNNTNLFIYCSIYARKDPATPVAPMSQRITSCCLRSLSGFLPEDTPTPVTSPIAYL